MNTLNTLSKSPLTYNDGNGIVITLIDIPEQEPGGLHVTFSIDSPVSDTIIRSFNLYDVMSVKQLGYFTRLRLVNVAYHAAMDAFICLVEESRSRQGQCVVLEDSCSGQGQAADFEDSGSGQGQCVVLGNSGSRQGQAAILEDSCSGQLQCAVLGYSGSRQEQQALLEEQGSGSGHGQAAEGRDAVDKLEIAGFKKIIARGARAAGSPSKQSVKKYYMSVVVLTRKGRVIHVHKSNAYQLPLRSPPAVSHCATKILMSHSNLRLARLSARCDMGP